MKPWTCPNCKRRTLQRLIGSGGGILFKGSGFYQTDYRSDSYKKAAAADKKAESGGGTGDDKAAKPAVDKPADDKSAADKPAPKKKSAATRAKA